VAKTCGGSESKVKMSLHRTRKKLREFLQEEGLWP
jgi:DNA-directed RNA polymerase specialized sigma24 family protein